jgi:2-amino-4-hydroxy-6-hydroxymethyldihydropteridine diphosphokinase
MVVGLGSNVGDRRATLLAALHAIAKIDQVRPISRSSLWQTAPVGGPPQDDFYNAATLIQTPVDPETVLAALFGIEAAFGRVRAGRNLPRTLDLDLLWIDAVAITLPGLTVPHPRLSERAFALAPLVEVAPDAVDPRTGVAYAAILANLDRTGVRRLPWGEPPR